MTLGFEKPGLLSHRAQIPFVLQPLGCRGGAAFGPRPMQTAPAGVQLELTSPCLCAMALRYAPM